MNAQETREVEVAAPATLLSVKLQQAMDAAGISIRDVAEQTGSSYENIRRLVKGMSIPSESLLRSICEVVGLDRGEMSKLARADKMRKTYGTVPLELAGKKPGMELLERVWDDLTREQQHGITTMAQGWAKMNRREV